MRACILCILIARVQCRWFMFSNWKGVFAYPFLLRVPYHDLHFVCRFIVLGFTEKMRFKEYKHFARSREETRSTFEFFFSKTIIKGGRELETVCKWKYILSWVIVQNFFIKNNENLWNFNYPRSSCLQQILISIFIDSNGVYDDHLCSSDTINHAMLIVGYTPTEWILKNWWGDRWGENGYMRLAKNKNRCGIANYAAYVKV